MSSKLTTEERYEALRNQLLEIEGMMRKIAFARSSENFTQSQNEEYKNLWLRFLLVSDQMKEIDIKLTT